MWDIKAIASTKLNPLSYCVVQGTVLPCLSHGFFVFHIHIVTGLNLEDQRRLEMAKDYSVIILIMGWKPFSSLSI